MGFPSKNWVYLLNTHTPFSIPIPNILCQNSLMRNLTAAICLTLAALLAEVLLTSHLKVGASNLSVGIGVNDDGTNPLRMEDPKKTIILIYTHRRYDILNLVYLI